MLYSIFQVSELGGTSCAIGISKDYVNRMVEAYVRGISQVVIEGRSYNIESETFQIYESPADLAESQQSSQRYLMWWFEEYANKNCHGNFYERVFSDNCKNVTNDFLKGKGFGDLQDDLYNVYVRIGEKRSITVAIEKDEVESFVKSWHYGESIGWLEGKSIPIAQAQNLRIYDIKLDHRKENKGETKRYINYDVRTLRKGIWNAAAFEYFGKDVTSEFKVKGFGSLNNASKMKESREDVDKSISNTSRSKIFISHSSQDDLKIKPLVDLLEIIGVPHDQIFYSSHPAYGVGLGENIFDRLKKELSGDVFALFILSDNFYKSPVCLCEMGAVWIKSSKQIPILIPPFEFKDVRGVFPDSLGFKINDARHLNSFKIEIERYFNLIKPIHITRWEEKRDEYLSKIDGLIS